MYCLYCIIRYRFQSVTNAHFITIHTNNMKCTKRSYSCNAHITLCVGFGKVFAQKREQNARKNATGSRFYPMHSAETSSSGYGRGVFPMIQNSWSGYLFDII